MKRFFAIVSFALISIPVGYAQSPQPAKSSPPAPAAKEAVVTAKALTVPEILKKYRAALGGSMAGKKITSMVTTGTFSMPAMGASGTIEIFSKAPNKTVNVVNLTGIGVITEGYDGTEAWSHDPINGLRIKSGLELARVKANAYFDRDAMLETIFPKMESKGVEKVEGRDAYVVVGTPAEGSPDIWYFDTQTFLMIRMDVVAESPQGRIPIQTYIDEYREVDGIKIPAVTRAVFPAYTVVIKVSDVKSNVAIEDSKFSKPKAQ